MVATRRSSATSIATVAAISSGTHPAQHPTHFFSEHRLDFREAKRCRSTELTYRRLGITTVRELMICCGVVPVGAERFGGGVNKWANKRASKCANKWASGAGFVPVVGSAPNNPNTNESTWEHVRWLMSSW